MQNQVSVQTQCKYLRCGRPHPNLRLPSRYCFPASLASLACMRGGVRNPQKVKPQDEPDRAFIHAAAVTLLGSAAGDPADLWRCRSEPADRTVAGSVARRATQHLAVTLGRPPRTGSATIAGSGRIAADFREWPGGSDNSGYSPAHGSVVHAISFTAQKLARSVAGLPHARVFGLGWWSRNSSAPAESVPARLRGEARGRFFDLLRLRDYRPGDPMRAID